MSIGALISEMQWTAVFAANLVATEPQGILRGLGIVIAALWIGARMTHRGSITHRVLAIALPLIVLPIVLVLAGAYLASDVVADTALESQQHALVENALLLIVEGIGITALAAFFWSPTSAEASQR